MFQKTNTVLHKQAREMLFSVFCYLEQEAEKLGKVKLLDLYQRTADATKTSISTVRRIIAEGKRTGGVLETPGQMRKRDKPITKLNDPDKDFVKNRIKEMQADPTQEISIKILHAKLQTNINFKGSEHSLRRIIKQLGYEWKKINGKRVLVMNDSQNEDDRKSKKQMDILQSANETNLSFTIKKKPVLDEDTREDNANFMTFTSVGNQYIAIKKEEQESEPEESFLHDENQDDIAKLMIFKEE